MSGPMSARELGMALQACGIFSVADLVDVRQSVWMCSAARRQPVWTCSAARGQLGVACKQRALCVQQDPRIKSPPDMAYDGRHVGSERST